MCTGLGLNVGQTHPGQLVQVRSTELAGVGSKAVVYTARLVGHPDFSLEATTIRVEPGTTASFAVQCKASTTNPQVAAQHKQPPASNPAAEAATM